MQPARRIARGRGRGRYQQPTPTDSGLGTHVASEEPIATAAAVQEQEQAAVAGQFDDVENVSSHIPQLDITHKMPKGGDQGVKPIGEKSWPDMWHDPTMSGPSPMSVSGRFELMPNGSEIPMHKPKKFSFSGRKKIENHDEKEAEQRLALNLQLQAPQRKLPEYVYDDFMAKARNCNQLLNEFIQHRRKTITWQDVPSSESFKNYSMAAVVGNRQFPPGSAWKKQLAKEAAAKNALKMLLLEYYQSTGDMSKVRAIEEMDEEQEKISRDVDHPTRYKPQPKIALSRLDESLLVGRKLNPEDVRRITELVGIHAHQLGIDKYHTQFCAYVLVYRGRMYEFEPKVISLATGDNLAYFDQAEGEFTRKPEVFKKGSNVSYGRVLNDTSAITLARRGVLRWLLHQAESFYETQLSTQFDEVDSIFKTIPESDKLVLNDTCEIVMVLSDLPHCIRETDSELKIHDLPDTKTIRASDKLAKWCVTGLQGAIGSRIMEPVYTAGIIMASGDDCDAIKFNNFLARILCKPILQRSCYLPGVFMPLRPNVTSCNLSQLQTKLPLRDDDEQICLEWCAQYAARAAKVQQINPKNGYAIKRDGLCASRLCKMAIFTIFKRVLEKRRLGDESTEAIYHKAKKLARDYRKCKRWIYNRFTYCDEGQWIQHPQREKIEDIFVALPRR